MPQPRVPKVDGDVKAEHGWCSGGGQRIQIAGAVTAEDNRPAVEILDRKTKRVKFNGDRIISCELTNGK